MCVCFPFMLLFPTFLCRLSAHISKKKILKRKSILRTVSKGTVSWPILPLFLKNRPIPLILCARNLHSALSVWLFRRRTDDKFERFEQTDVSGDRQTGGTRWMETGAVLLLNVCVCLCIWTGWILVGWFVGQEKEKEKKKKKKKMLHILYYAFLLLYPSLLLLPRVPTNLPFFLLTTFLLPVLLYYIMTMPMSFSLMYSVYSIYV